MSTDPVKWDNHVAITTGWCHFLQSAEWAKAHHHTAWQPELTEVNGLPLAIYNRSVKGIGRIYLSTKIAQLAPAQVTGFTDGLRQLAKGAVVVKVDIDQPFSEELHQTLLASGWLKSPSIQYRETVVVDLAIGEEELLKSFKKRARWELNAGLRRGVKVENLDVTPANIKLVYDLLNQTYERANFHTRSRQFTETYWREFAAEGHGAMFVASLEGKPLAAAYIIRIGDRAYYKDGASIRVKPDVFASRVMQWQIMRYLMGQGVKQYDLCGVSTHVGSDLSGVTLFKTGFGEPVQLQWGYELPLSGAKYKVWKKLGEPLATKYSSAVRKELWY